MSYDDGERTMIRTSRPRLPAAEARLGWVHDLVYTDEAGQPQRLRLGLLPLRIGRRAPCSCSSRTSRSRACTARCSCRATT
jgi:hypothetical protein